MHTTHLWISLCFFGQIISKRVFLTNNSVLVITLFKINPQSPRDGSIASRYTTWSNVLSVVDSTMFTSLGIMLDWWGGMTDWWTPRRPAFINRQTPSLILHTVHRSNNAYVSRTYEKESTRNLLLLQCENRQTHFGDARVTIGHVMGQSVMKSASTPITHTVLIPK